MASTPPPPAERAHTPPTPLHGLRYDTYEPYSPRRSKRATAQSNPYSSFNSDRSPRTVRADAATTTPPATVKQARFAGAVTHLSSPPSSPTSPARRLSPRQLHKTPRKQPLPSSSSAGANGALSDSDGPSHSSLASTMHPPAMLPTPAKTPKKQRAAVASTARVLNFQPSDPNDVMPSPRRMTKRRQQRGNGFDLYEDEPVQRADGIEIFTDANARIPELDGSEDNPFVGPKKRGRRSQRKSNDGISQARREHDAKLAEAVANDEGVTYVFRGRKVFRRFDDSQQADDGLSVDGSEISGTFEQRHLRRQAGAAAQRPFTRSAIQPRLLFPSEEQRLEREQVQAHEDDEEALTDIDMSNADFVTNHDEPHYSHPPARQNSSDVNGLTPPPSARHHSNKRSAHVKTAAFADDTPAVVEEDAESLLPVPDTFPGKQSSSVNGRGNKKQSPFDSWQRTKSTRKRAGDGAREDGANGKRARSVAPESPV